MGSLADYIKELQTDYAKNNIYSQLGGSILGADVNVRGGSPYVNFATNLLKGLAGGGLNQMALADAREYNTGINSVFSDVLGGQSVRPIEGLSSGELGDLTTAANIFKTQRTQSLKDALDAATIDAIGTGMAKEAQLGAGQKYQDQQRAALGEMLGTQPLAKTDGGRESIEDIRRKAVAEAQLLGITPGDYNEYAAQKIKLQTQATDRALKDLETKRESIRNLDEIITSAEEGIAKAGQTGGLVPGVRRLGDTALSIIPGLGDAADQRLVGDALLDTVAQKGVGLNRIAGTGAMSDFESKALFSSFIGKDKTPEQNSKILEKLKQTRETQNEYLSFKRNWIDTYGTDQGSDTAWEGYKKINPIVVKKDNGEFDFNSQRKPWQKYDLNELEQIGKSPNKIELSNSENIVTKTLKDGTKVKVKPLGNGKYEVVE